jgi:hypothetical protein
MLRKAPTSAGIPSSSARDIKPSWRLRQKHGTLNFPEKVLFSKKISLVSSPSTRSRSGGGLPQFLLEHPAVCGSRETPFARGQSPSRLRPHEVVAVFDPPARIAFFEKPFSFPSRTLRQGFTFRLSPLVHSWTSRMASGRGGSGGGAAASRGKEATPDREGCMAGGVTTNPSRRHRR